MPWHSVPPGGRQTPGANLPHRLSDQGYLRDRGGHCGGSARARAAERTRARYGWCQGESIQCGYGSRALNGRLDVVIERDEPNANLVAIERLIALDARVAGSQIEVRLSEPTLGGHEEHEGDEQPDADGTT